MEINWLVRITLSYISGWPCTSKSAASFYWSKNENSPLRLMYPAARAAVTIDGYLSVRVLHFWTMCSCWHYNGTYFLSPVHFTFCTASVQLAKQSPYCQYLTLQLFIHSFGFTRLCFLLLRKARMDHLRIFQIILFLNSRPWVKGLCAWI